MSRRDFLTAASLATVSLTLPKARGERAPTPPKIDIHMHYGAGRGRTAQQVPVHQTNIGATFTVILPANPEDNDMAREFTRGDPAHWACFARDYANSDGAVERLEQTLKRGAIGIGELKDKIACDSPQMHEIASLARDHDVPMLFHFEDRAWNDGFARFHRMLEKFPTVKFIGHAQTFWANIDQRHKPEEDAGYPKGPVTAGGLTDRWLADYPNFYGDLAAGSGNNALMRDPAFAAAFVQRHQDKLMYGSDCSCLTGIGPSCGSQTKNAALKVLALDEGIREKILHSNARRLLKLNNGKGGGND